MLHKNSDYMKHACNLNSLPQSISTQLEKDTITIKLPKAGCTLTWRSTLNPEGTKKKLCVGRNCFARLWDSTEKYCINSVVLNQLYK